MVFSKKIIIKKTPFDIPILLFLGSQILSTVFSIDRQTSLFGYYGRFNGGLISIFSYIVLYYGFVSNIKVEYVFKLLKISFISSLIVVLWGIPGKFGKDLSCLLFTGQFNNGCWTDQFRPAERMFSTLGQPNWLGAYLAINFFIGIYFLVRSYKDGKKIVSLIHCFIVILIFMAIFFTKSRSALLSVVVGLVVAGIFFVYIRLRQKTKIAKRLAFSIFITLVVSGILFLAMNQWNKSIIKSSDDVTESADLRKIVWKGAVDLGLRYPVFGTGVETFAYSYYFVRPQEHNLTSEWDFLYNKAHNEYLNYFATTGFTGIVSYLAFIGIVFIYSWKKIKNQKSKIKVASQNSKKDNNETREQLNNQLLTICLILSYITILITNFFGFSTTTINLFFYLIPAFIVLINDKQLAISNRQLTYPNLSLFQKVSLLIVLSSFFYLLLYLSRYYLADINYAKGDNLSKVGEYQKAIQFLDSAYNIKYEHIYEDKLSYAFANIAFLASYQQKEDLVKEMVKTSDLLNLKSIKASPKNVLYWKTRAKNYYLFYQISLDRKDLEAGIEALLEAQRLSPTDPKIPYSLAIYYSLAEQDVDEISNKLQFSDLSFRYIDKSIQLKPDYRDGYFLKGQLLKKANKNAEAKKAFDYILRNLNPQDAEAKKELDSL
ncbi:O-antigen ligase family protein [Candidatus Roizmanbacteria bacterium]|nr:O-antigen ligase family protein [Candidatus Roizmanbacteria bacterium]